MSLSLVTQIILIAFFTNLIATDGHLSTELLIRKLERRLDSLNSTQFGIPALVTGELKRGLEKYSSNAQLFSDDIEFNFEDEDRFQERLKKFQRTWSKFDEEILEFKTNGARDFLISKLSSRFRKIVNFMNVQMKKLLAEGDQDKIALALKKNLTQVENFFDDIIARFKQLVVKEIKLLQNNLSHLEE